MCAQVVVNFSASEGPAQEVVAAIKEAGGDAIAVGADISKKEDIDRCVLGADDVMFAACEVPYETCTDCSVKKHGTLCCLFRWQHVWNALAWGHD